MQGPQWFRLSVNLAIRPGQLDAAAAALLRTAANTPGIAYIDDWRLEPLGGGVGYAGVGPPEAKSA